MYKTTRKNVCKALLGISLLEIAATFASPSRKSSAEESTLAALEYAQYQYGEVQARIDELAAACESLSIELDQTMSAIETKNAEIAQTQLQIEQTRAELEQCQNDLAIYVSNSYKNGNASLLDVLLASSDFEELFRNVYYLTKISDSQTQLIEHAKQVKAQLEEQERLLEEQLIGLEDLRALQESQLWDLQDAQTQCYYLLSDLGDQVQALTAQYNEELIEQARAAAEAEALASQQASGAYGGNSANAVIGCCNSTPSPGAGYCAAWVTNVFVNAGIGYFGGDACDMYSSWCYTSDRGSLYPGMIVAVSSHPQTAAGRIYGHVGIYIGGGTVMDNIGYIRTIDLESWLSHYGSTVTPRWGWLGGVSLG